MALNVVVFGLFTIIRADCLPLKTQLNFFTNQVLFILPNRLLLGVLHNDGVIGVTLQVIFLKLSGYYRSP